MILLQKELIVNKYHGTFSASDNWGFSAVVRSPMSSYPETMWLEGEETGYADYLPEIMAVGKVRISAFIPGYSNQDPEIKFEIHGAYETTVKYVDATKYSQDEGDWLILDTVEFSGSGKEFVRVVRESRKGTTRISTVLFEILNSAEKGDVWQYIYVGPNRIDIEKKKLMTFDTFNDIDNVECRKEIEYLAYKEIIPKNDGKFEPYKNITVNDFCDWFSKIFPEYKQSDIKSVTKQNIVKIIYDEILLSGINIEHAGKLSDMEDVLRKLGIFTSDFVVSDSVLSRLEAAHILKKLYYFVLGGVSRDKWKLAFYDDFDGDEINTDIWDLEHGVSNHILSSRWRENDTVSDSKLKLLTKKEIRPEAPQQNWTTGSISTRRDVFMQTYGYWEASMKINSSPGINNAFWLVCGEFEIDIVEAHYMNTVNATYHYPGNAQSEKYHTEYDLSEDFHLYALEWNEKELIYFFDGKEIARMKNVNAHKPVITLFSSAILNWAGAVDEDKADGSALEVEWIRVYKEK